MGTSGKRIDHRSLRILRVQQVQEGRGDRNPTAMEPVARIVPRPQPNGYTNDLFDVDRETFVTVGPPRQQDRRSGNLRECP